MLSGIPLAATLAMNGLLNAPWKRWLLRLRQQVTQDSLTQAAAALGFFAMLSLFPLLIFMLSVVAYLPLPGLETAIMSFFHDLLPKAGAQLVETTVKNVVHSHRLNLLSFGLVGAMWFASSAMHSVVVHLDKTFGVHKPRPFVKVRLLSVALTFVLGLLVLAALTLMVFGDKLESFLMGEGRVGWEVRWGFAILRWGLIISFLMLGFAIVYYLGPSARRRFGWISPGAVVGVALLVLASLGFRFYVLHFGHYQMIYGALGTVIVLMLWLYVFGLALLIGSEVNVTLAADPSSPTDSRRSVPQSERRPSIR